MKTSRRNIVKVGSLVVLALILFTFSYYHNEIFGLMGLFQNTPAISVQTTPEPVQKTGPTLLVLPQVIAAEPIPLVYSDTFNEDRIQDYLKEGAVVLPLGKQLGEAGNMVITAHSSGFESFGPYRFAFAKLGNIKNGEQFTISTPNATYTYKVYDRQIVWPNEIDKLPNDNRSTVTLVTCWPNWTNLKRLLIDAELVKTELHT